MEARILYSTIKYALADRIKDHWHNHPDSYRTLEADRLGMLRALGQFTGNDVAADIEELQRLLDSLVTK